MKMKLAKIAVWSTAFVVALLYVILNAILLAVVSLSVALTGVSELLGGQALAVPTSVGQWFVYLCSSFAIVFLVTALTVWLYNLLAIKFAIKLELKGK